MKASVFVIFLSLILWGCQKGLPEGAIEIFPVDSTLSDTGFAKGADVSWVTEQEDSGVKFYNDLGEQQDLFQILKSKGVNSIRLRVWVNPADGYCGLEDVIKKAKRVSQNDMRLMLDFHYSDSWADPGQQTKPAAWTSLDFLDLKQTLYDYTFSVLDTLKDLGITPEWVQVGNETNDGMLWEDGRASNNMKNFAALITSGYNAVKAVDSSIKVIVHLSNGYDNSMYRWMFDGLKDNNAKWDVIGMSLYPSADDWSSKNDQCLDNMKDMIDRYGSEIMICEVGMPATEAVACKAFLTDLIGKVKSLPDNKGLGVFYWEPQAYNSWKGYKLGAFDDSGRPTAALDAFLSK